MNRQIRRPSRTSAYHQRGLSLIELSLGLLIAAVVIGFGIKAFNYVMADTRAQDAQRALLQIVAGAKALKSNNAYTGITAQVLIDANKAPEDLVQGTTISNPFSGTFTVAAFSANGGTDNAVKVCANQVPRSECASLVNNTGPSMARVIVGADCNATTTVLRDRIGTTPVNPTPATIATACANDNNTLQFISL
ncbi:MAG: hypothetical protein E6Q44_13330 [Flavobacteriales bacterium]|jgi:Tfp pilus assembly protein PilE|nr:MAG: hypothetical protein E6Q44_13330 [Flavobacteriales bacterium]